MASVIDKAAALEASRQILKTLEFVATFKDVLEQATAAENDLARIRKSVAAEESRIATLHDQIAKLTNEHGQRQIALDKDLVVAAGKIADTVAGHRAGADADLARINAQIESARASLAGLNAQNAALGLRAAAEKKEIESQHAALKAKLAQDREAAENEIKALRQQVASALRKQLANVNALSVGVQ